MFGDAPVDARQATGNRSADLQEDEVKWEYKSSDEGELTGPLTTAEIMKVPYKKD